jgi:WhiB family redox-sensing transcriptional regulator
MTAVTLEAPGHLDAVRETVRRMSAGASPDLTMLIARNVGLDAAEVQAMGEQAAQAGPAPEITAERDRTQITAAEWKQIIYMLTHGNQVRTVARLMVMPRAEIRAIGKEAGLESAGLDMRWPKEAPAPEAPTGYTEGELARIRANRATRTQARMEALARERAHRARELRAAEAASCQVPDKIDMGQAEGYRWQDDALCATADPEEWFPEKGGTTRWAKKICWEHCPVRKQCLQLALDNDERFGVWGGLSERERRRLKRQQAGLPDEPDEDDEDGPLDEEPDEAEVAA